MFGSELYNIAEEKPAVVTAPHASQWSYGVIVLPMTDLR